MEAHVQYFSLIASAAAIAILAGCGGGSSLATKTETETPEKASPETDAPDQPEIGTMDPEAETESPEDQAETPPTTDGGTQTPTPTNPTPPTPPTPTPTPPPDPETEMEEETEEQTERMTEPDESKFHLVQNILRENLNLVLGANGTTDIKEKERRFTSHGVPIFRIYHDNLNHPWLDVVGDYPAAVQFAKREKFESGSDYTTFGYWMAGPKTPYAKSGTHKPQPDKEVRLDGYLFAAGGSRPATGLDGSQG